MEAFHGEKQNEDGVWKKIWKVFIMFFTIHAVDTGRKLNVHKTFRTSSERLMYVQFTSCIYGAPARSEDYESVADSNSYALRFCSSR